MFARATVHIVRLRDAMDFVSWKHRKPCSGALGALTAPSMPRLARKRLLPSKPADGAVLSRNQPELTS